MAKVEILKDLSGFGKQFTSSGFNQKELKTNPIDQFLAWLENAIESGVEEPNPMVLSTVSKEQKPSSRVVLLKYITSEGFVFFTNYESRKGQQLETIPNASAVFFWPQLERQVRIEGRIEKIDKDFSDTYFKSRSLESQVGAIVSPQSKAIPSKDHLLEKIEELEESFKNKKLVRPFYWGGYILIPERMEFWQGAPHRLSDRFQYRLENGNWIIERLAP